jgi:transposase
MATVSKRRRRGKQASMWVATQDLPRSAAHPLYARLNQILEQHDFDGYVEGLCERFYADDGRPGLPPGRYFRLLLIGYFEGLAAERAIAWRAADSFALREFLALVLPEAPPDHSTISRTRRLIDLETHEAVFTWMLQRLAAASLVKGKTVGIDATTLEANAAMRSIVRRDTGESYQDFLTKLAQASGIETPTRADLARIDRKRKKKGSNDDWTHPHDPDAKITKMKDGRTHLAHKAEHAVDLETGAIVGVTVQDADDGDTETSIETLITAAEQIEAVRPDDDGLQEVVADKGYHSNQSLIDLEAVGVRSYISEPDRGRRNWRKKAEARAAVYRNRRRIRGARGLRLLRLRGEAGGRVGIMRRQINERPLARESENACERAARDARIRTDAVNCSCHQLTLVVARVASEQERRPTPNDNGHVVRRVARRGDDRDVAAPPQRHRLLQKDGYQETGRGRAR